MSDSVNNQIVQGHNTITMTDKRNITNTAVHIYQGLCYFDVLAKGVGIIIKELSAFQNATIQSDQ